MADLTDTRTDLDWADVDRLARALADRLPARSGIAEFDRVIGISRGGLVPATLLASHLGVKRVESVQVRFYDGDQRLAEPALIGAQPTAYGPSGDPKRTLVVDEILDTGSTMRFLYELFPLATFACLVARTPEPLDPGGDLLTRTCDPEGDASHHVWVVEALATERWILFPWSPPEDRAAGRAAQ